jgi:pyruvate/2-oxoglutarate dehydrogenase complex dihydrolipoamide dehydrogenase (E3) component/uncharacterized membrane protein YdjX (TVP38/TMEM64 family)
MKKPPQRNGIRIAILLLLVVGAFAFFQSDLRNQLTLEAFRAAQSDLARRVAERPLETMGLFFLLYVAVAAAAIPGATVLTLAAGALFGLWKGFLVVSFASTVGATLAMLLSRLLFRDFLQRKFRAELERIDRGFEREGAFYLFALRLAPVFPFFVVNAVMGLVKIRVSTYYWVSQLGMIPGTLVYVNVGTQLGQITSLKGVVSPALLASFAALGILPLVMKRVLEGLRRRRALRGFRKPKRFDYDVVAIGGGAAGLVTCYIAAAAKAKSALVERHKMGGDCLYTGCVPSKALIRAAKLAGEKRKLEKLGVRSMNLEFDFARVMEEVQSVVKAIEPHDSVERYTGLGVDCLKGQATVVDPWTVEVNGRRLTARAIVIASGAEPIVPPIPGLAEAPYYTSETLWSLRAQPKRLVVLGGGPIGCELGQAFQRLGSRVTLVEKAPRLVVREDEEAARILEHTFRDEGMDVRTGCEATRVERTASGWALVLRDAAGREERVECDAILCALGRRARTTGFGLEKLGIRTTPQGTLEVDAYLRTSVPTIYACGDVAGPMQFTHLAAHTAWYASVNGLLAPWKAFAADFRVIPRVTYTQPEIASVGMSEGEAEAKGIAAEVTRYGIDDLDRAIADREAEGYVKIVTEAGSDRILGVTIVAAHAGEMLAEWTLAMRHRLGVNKVLQTVHPYPTFSEANKYAAGNWRKARINPALLACAAKFFAWRRGERALPF